MIEFQQISKTYRVARRPAGMGNAVKAFFHRGYETILMKKEVNL